MEKRTSWFDRLMAAATFAEAGEHETAKQFIRDDARCKTEAKQGHDLCGEAGLHSDLGIVGTKS